MKFKNYFALVLMLCGSLIVGLSILGYITTVNTDKFDAIFSIVFISGIVMLISGITYGLVLLIKHKNKE